MSRKKVYAALSEFGKDDDTARRLLVQAGFDLGENASGRRILRGEMIGALYDADAVLAGLEPYDGELLRSLPRLRCISRCGVGTDTIDMEAARRHNIAVFATADEVVEPVAQMTVAMILALARNLPSHVLDFQAGTWRKHSGYLLGEWTIGLVGFGRIGRAVERYLRVFKPRVIVADPAVRAGELPPGVELRTLSALLSESDVVSLHASRRREEGPLLSRTEIGLIKAGSRLVNTSRGYLVDEPALYEALRSGHLAAAGIDVFDQEPYEGPLAKLPQVLCTPHVASLTRRSRIAMEIRCAKNVIDFFARHAAVGSAKSGS